MQELLRFIPKEYKPFVTDIYEGKREYNEITKRWNVQLVVEWENGETSEFANKTFARECIKETYMIDDVRKVR